MRELGTLLNSKMHELFSYKANGVVNAPSWFRLCAATATATATATAATAATAACSSAAAAKDAAACSSAPLCSSSLTHVYPAPHP